MGRRPRILTEAEENVALEHALNGLPLSKTSETLGFSSTKEFWEYRQRNPLFEKALQSARQAACDHLEDLILTVTDLHPDPKTARVRLEALCRALAFRNPARYGHRVELTVNQTVDLSGALRDAATRLLPTSPDIPVIPKSFNDLE